MRSFYKFIHSMAPFDRRPNKRFLIFPLLECACKYPFFTQTETCGANLTDISKSGFLMVTDGHEILPNTIVQFIFKISGRPSSLVIYGKIIRTFKKEDSPHYISGVKFQNVSDEDVETLFDFALTHKTI